MRILYFFILWLIIILINLCDPTFRDGIFFVNILLNQKEKIYENKIFLANNYGRFFKDDIELINNTRINVFSKNKNEDPTFQNGIFFVNILCNQKENIYENKFFLANIYGRFFIDGIDLINNTKINVFSKSKNEKFFIYYEVISIYHQYVSSLIC